jgi:hypothetical protein
MQSKSTAQNTLKALILSCMPESGEFLHPLDMLSSPIFSIPDVAISHSVQEKGHLRSLAASCRVFCQTDRESLLLRLNTYDLLIVFPLSLNTLAKFALGIRDSFPSELLWQFAAIGRPILLNEELLPDEKTTMNPHMFRIYRQHWQNVTSSSICGFNRENLEERARKIIRARASAARSPADSARIFITRDDIISAADSLEPLRLPSNAVITELAREEADARGVIIIQD